MNKYYIAALGGVVLTTIAQIMLKFGAEKGRGKLWVAKYFNKAALSGYILFVGVTVLNLYALQKIRLVEMVFIVPINYLLIIILSRWIFKDKISNRQWIGIAFILLGIVIFNLNLFDSV